MVTTADIIVFNREGKVYEHLKVNEEGQEEKVG
jgi:hypothetical protein